MMTKKKTWDLYERLEKFTHDLAKKADDCTDTQEIEILLPILEKAISLKEAMEVLL